MRIGYFGPEGTLPRRRCSPRPRRWPSTSTRVALPTIYDTVMAVHDGTVERALVPIENSLEGSVNATLDALAHDTERVDIVGEVVMPIRHCLIARTELALDEIEVVVSHPQATAECARFIRASLPQARVIAAARRPRRSGRSPGHEGPWAALGNRTAAEHYGCVVLGPGSRTCRATRPGSSGWAAVRLAMAAGRPGGADGRAPRRRVQDRDRVLGAAPNGQDGWSRAWRRSRAAIST